MSEHARRDRHGITAVVLRTSRARGFFAARGYTQGRVLAIGDARTYNTIIGTGTHVVRRIAPAAAAGEHAA